MMDRSFYLRAGALYLPLLFAMLAGAARKQPPRQFAACLLSLLWTLPSLLVLQRLNQLAHWWSFASDGPLLRGMPLELLFGWTILWGVLPQLTFPGLSPWRCTALMVALDLAAMPLLAPILVLGPRWLLGEAAAVALVLIPSLLLARWTLAGTHLRGRAAFQAATAALIFLFLFPDLAFALRPGTGWEPLLRMPAWQRRLALEFVLVFALPGLGAVMEFAQRGGGTPIPYDPPRQLVTSGIYRFVANPMQLSTAAVLVLWAALLRNPWLLIPFALSVVYSAGIAEWDEASDLAQRFGEPWRLFRCSVHNWRPRWRPFHAGPPAKLYIARTCGPCSEIRTGLEARHPLGLEIVDAETLPEGSIRRIRYDPGHGSATEEGVRAMGRALEHLHFLWAIAGTALRLPLVSHLVQLALDAGGLGPRTIPGNAPEACLTRPSGSSPRS